MKIPSHNARMGTVQQKNGPPRPATFKLCNCSACVAMWVRVAESNRDAKTKK